MGVDDPPKGVLHGDTVADQRVRTTLGGKQVGKEPLELNP
jgi:hypothetical protein